MSALSYGSILPNAMATVDRSTKHPQSGAREFAQRIAEVNADGTRRALLLGLPSDVFRFILLRMLDSQSAIIFSRLNQSARRLMASAPAPNALTFSTDHTLDWFQYRVWSGRRRRLYLSPRQLVTFSTSLVMQREQDIALVVECTATYMLVLDAPRLDMRASDEITLAQVRSALSRYYCLRGLTLIVRYTAPSGRRRCSTQFNAMSYIDAVFSEWASRTAYLTLDLPVGGSICIEEIITPHLRKLSDLQILDVNPDGWTDLPALNFVSFKVHQRSNEWPASAAVEPLLPGSHLSQHRNLQSAVPQHICCASNGSGDNNFHTPANMLLDPYGQRCNDSGRVKPEISTLLQPKLRANHPAGLLMFDLRGSKSHAQLASPYLELRSQEIPNPSCRWTFLPSAVKGGRETVYAAQTAPVSIRFDHAATQAIRNFLITNGTLEREIIQAAWRTAYSLLTESFSIQSVQISPLLTSGPYGMQFDKSPLLSSSPVASQVLPSLDPPVDSSHFRQLHISLPGITDIPVAYTMIDLAPAGALTQVARLVVGCPAEMVHNDCEETTSLMTMLMESISGSLPSLRHLGLAPAARFDSFTYFRGITHLDLLQRCNTVELAAHQVTAIALQLRHLEVLLLAVEVPTVRKDVMQCLMPLLLSSDTLREITYLWHCKFTESIAQSLPYGTTHQQRDMTLRQLHLFWQQLQPSHARPGMDTNTTAFTGADDTIAFQPQLLLPFLSTEDRLKYLASAMHLSTSLHYDEAVEFLEEEVIAPSTWWSCCLPSRQHRWYVRTPEVVQASHLPPPAIRQNRQEDEQLWEEAAAQYLSAWMAQPYSPHPVATRPLELRFLHHPSFQSYLFDEWHSSRRL